MLNFKYHDFVDMFKINYIFTQTIQGIKNIIAELKDLFFPAKNTKVFFITLPHDVEKCICLYVKIVLKLFLLLI